MTTGARQARRGVSPRGLRRDRDLKAEAYVFICQENPSGAGLARILGVSLPTAMRLVAALRRDGLDVVSVRRKGEAHYEIRNGESWEDIENDPLLAYVIPKGKVRPARPKEEDRSIYG